MHTPSFEASSFTAALASSPSPAAAAAAASSSPHAVQSRLSSFGLGVSTCRPPPRKKENHPHSHKQMHTATPPLLGTPHNPHHLRQRPLLRAPERPVRPLRYQGEPVAVNHHWQPLVERPLKHVRGVAQHLRVAAEA